MISNLKYDLPASLVVFLVALPLCLGISMASGTPLLSGIIAGVVGGIVVGFFSGSHTSVSGPTASLITTVAIAITQLPAYEAVLLSIVIAGVIQVILGKLKAGLVADFIPVSVIKGVLAAIGLILILKEIPHLVGYDVDFMGDESFEQPDGNNTFSELFNVIDRITPVATLIGFLAIAIQILWEFPMFKKNKILSLIPAPLVIVFMGIGINVFLAESNHRLALSENHLVALPVAKSVSEFAAFFTFPKLEFLTVPKVWITAVTIAIIASLETLSSLSAADKLDPYKRVSPANRELIAQGAGNIVSGLLGGLPVVAVIVRSSTNINAGARTKWSAIFHGILFLLCTCFIPELLNLIPLSALAGVLVFVGYKLAKPSLFTELYKKGLDQFLPFVITIVAILFTDLLIGILVGILSALFFIVRSNFKTAILFVQDKNLYLVRLRSEVSFLNKSFLKQQLEQIPANSKVLFDATKSNFVDKDIIEVIEDFNCSAALKNINVAFKKPSHDRDFFAALRKENDSEEFIYSTHFK
ncbi:MAG TPA: SulP family inorganic anion transporter [Chitinophagales bacterium]